MALEDERGGGGVDEGKRQRRERRLTPGWLRTVQEGNRRAFEREMQRHRDGFHREFERFWRRRGQAG